MELTIPITFDDEQLKKIAEDVLARLCADCPYRRNGENYLKEFERIDTIADRN